MSLVSKYLLGDAVEELISAGSSVCSWSASCRLNSGWGEPKVRGCELVLTLCITKVQGPVAQAGEGHSETWQEPVTTGFQVLRL